MPNVLVIIPVAASLVFLPDVVVVVGVVVVVVGGVVVVLGVVVFGAVFAVVVS